MEKVENEKVSIIDELKSLALIQAQYDKLMIVTKIREVKQAANNKINVIYNFIDVNSKADVYKRNKEQINIAKDEYEKKIKEVNVNYELDAVSLLESRTKIETLETKALGRMAELKKEIADGKKTEQYESWKKTYEVYVKDAKAAKEIAKTGKAEDMNVYYEKLNEVRRMEKENPIYAKLQEQKQGRAYLEKASELLKENETKQKELKEKANETIKLAMEDKTTALAKVEKQNIFQKMIGAIYNRFGGGKRFEKYVLNPLKENLAKFKEVVVPSFIEKSSDIVGEKVNEDKSLKIKPVERIKHIIGKGIETKDNIVKSVSDKIHSIKENTQKKIDDMQKEGHNDVEK